LVWSRCFCSIWSRCFCSIWSRCFCLVWRLSSVWNRKPNHDSPIRNASVQLGHSTEDQSIVAANILERLKFLMIGRDMALHPNVIPVIVDHTIDRVHILHIDIPILGVNMYPETHVKCRCPPNRDQREIRLEVSETSLKNDGHCRRPAGFQPESLPRPGAPDRSWITARSHHFRNVALAPGVVHALGPRADPVRRNVPNKGA
jgi:hypothetical protein